MVVLCLDLERMIARAHTGEMYSLLRKALALTSDPRLSRAAVVVLVERSSGAKELVGKVDLCKIVQSAPHNDPNYPPGGTLECLMEYISTKMTPLSAILHATERTSTKSIARLLIRTVDEFGSKRLPARPPLEVVQQDFRVFGVPLEVAAARSPDQNQAVPTVVKKCVEYLSSERSLKEMGLFRQSGRLQDIEEICESFNNGVDVDLSLVKDPHVVTGVLKKFLRDLPSPLLGGVTATDRQLPQLCKEVSELPVANRQTCLLLFTLLAKVCERADVNKMNRDNLTTVLFGTFGTTPGVFDSLLGHVHEVFVGDKVEVEQKPKQQQQQEDFGWSSSDDDIEFDFGGLSVPSFTVLNLK